jgi:outer membrane immunogenic protein
MNRSVLIVAGVACMAFTAATAQADDVAGSRRVNWTGFYAGVHAGYGLGNTDFGNSDFGALDIQGKGGLGGIQLGYNQQIGNLLLGVEGDFSFSGYKGERSLTFAPVTITQNSKIKWLSTLTGRVGLTNGPWLTYAKAGVAWAKQDYGYLLTVTAPAETINMSTSETRSGWIIGAGIEYALANQWSVRGEYNYISFADRSYNATGTDSLLGPAQTTGHAMQNLHLVKLGLNYQLGGPKNTNTIEPVQYAAAGYDWSGIYIGGQFGYGSAKNNWRGYDPLGGYSGKGGLAGGQIGANVQVGALVFGVEAELLGGNIKGSSTFLAAPATVTLTSKADWLAMATARVGFATHQRWLPYLKVGVAAMNNRHTLDIVQSGLGFANFSAQRIHTGLVIGGGLEYAFAKNWSTRIEYDYIDFGMDTVVSSGIINAPPLVGALYIRNPISTSMHLAKLGINYHFAP